MNRSEIEKTKRKYTKEFSLKVIGQQFAEAFGDDRRHDSFRCWLFVVSCLNRKVIEWNGASILFAPPLQSKLHKRPTGAAKNSATWSATRSSSVRPSTGGRIEMTAPRYALRASGLLDDQPQQYNIYFLLA
jgi:hypothetical protein